MMNGDEIGGAAKGALGKAEGLAGKALGDTDLQVDGAAREIEGGLQKAGGKVQETADRLHDIIGKLADQATSALHTVTEKAQGLYSQASDKAKQAGETVTPFVRERPYPSLAIAAAAGFVIGALIAGRAPKVIVIKPRL